ncbi:uncharacterized protein LOC113288340 isoform X1 [Papaver somniferum]|uniref:uncharacterized protein LOC113288340 isoform X1 n=1 Tax=Papaver somniferum TaxID=3469 RepID=UPI000E6F5E89|nr:uncharacterized protein LOC113288340 isoform X1 [Papaver somniferum]
MDYHSMKRKDLQSLCKKHHIPANMTNSAMADALSALNLVDEIEETVPETERPVTSRNSLTAIKPQTDLIDDNEPRIPVGGARTRRAPLREKPVEEILAKTAAPTACQKKIQGKVVSKAKENDNEKVKEEEVPVVNTRRSTKLHQESKLKISESAQEVEAKKIGVLSEEVNVKDKGNNNEKEEKEVPVVNHVAKRSRRSQQKSKLEISESAQEVEAKKTDIMMSEEVNVKDKGNNNEKEKEDPVVNHVTKQSKRLQQKSKLTSESVQEVEAKKTDMLAEEVNVKDKGNNNEKEEEVVVVNPVTKRSRRLQQKSKLKTSESVQEVEAKKEAKKTDLMLSEEVNVKDKGNNNEEEEVVVVNPVAKRSKRLQQKSMLKISESAQEVETKKTDMLSEEVNGEEMKSEFEVIDVVLQKNDGIDGNSSKEAQDNVASGSVDVVEKTMPESPETSRKPLSARKPQCDLVVNEPEIPVRLARSRRPRLLGNSSASEEIIPKIAAPTACRKKTEGKLASKAKGNNNEKEEEVPVVNHVAKRSTRLQKKSMLKVSESVLKAGETNEAKKTDMLSEKVVVEEMKSESEVTDDVLLNNEGINGNSSKDEQDDLASGNVDGVEKTVPESTVTTRNSSTAIKPQSDLVDNEPRIPVRLARTRRAPLLEKSVASVKEIIPKTSALRTSPKEASGRSVSWAKEIDNEKEEEVPVVTHISRQSTRLHKKSKLKKFEGVQKVEAKKSDMLSEQVNAEEMKSEITDVVLQKNDGINCNSSEEEQDDVASGSVSSVVVSSEFSMLEESKDFEDTVESSVTSEEPSTALIMGELPKDSATHVFSECVSEDHSAFTVPPEESFLVEANTEITKVYTELLMVERSGDVEEITVDSYVNCEDPSSALIIDELSKASTTHAFVEENTEITKVCIGSEDQPFEKNEDKGVLDMVVKVENEPAYVVVTDAEALVGDESSPISENMDRLENTDVDDVERKCEAELCSANTNEVEELSLDPDMLPEEVNILELKSESEVTEVVLQKNDGIDGNSSNEQQDDVASRNVSVIMVSTELSMLEKSGDFEKITCNSNVTSEDPASASVMGELFKASSPHAFGDCISEDGVVCMMSAEESKVNIGNVYSESSLVDWVSGAETSENLNFNSQPVECADQVKENEVIEEKDVNDLESKATDKNEITYFVPSDVEVLSVDESSPIAEITENLQDSDAYEVASKLECETDTYAVNLSEPEELSLDSDHFSLQAMQDSMEEAMNNQEDENCTLKIQQENVCDKVQGVNVAAIFDPMAICGAVVDGLFDEETSYDKENNSDGALVILDTVEENEKDNSGDTVDENDDSCVVDEISDVGADLIVKQTPVISEGEALSFDGFSPTLANTENLEESYVKLVISGVEENEDSSDMDEISDVVATDQIVKQTPVLSEGVALSVDGSSPTLANTENLEDSYVKLVISGVEENENDNSGDIDEISDVKQIPVLSEVEALSVDGSSPTLATTENLEDSFVKLMISDSVEENENCSEISDVVATDLLVKQTPVLSEVEPLSLDRSSPTVRDTENLEDTDVYELANKLECETEIYVGNVSELEEFILDSDCFYFQAMKDLMEEAMDFQEAENCTSEIHQDCDKSNCVNVAANIETSYAEEADSDVVEENEDSSGDIVEENEHSPDMDVVATVPTVKQTPVLSEVETLSLGSSATVRNTENLEDSDVYKVANKVECETEVYVINVSELEELSLDCDCFYFQAMKDVEEVMDGLEAEKCTFEIQQDSDKSPCVNVAADTETSYAEEADSDVKLVISGVEENEKDNSDDIVDENADGSAVDETSDAVATDGIVKQIPVPLATPIKINTSANQVQQIPRMSTTKKKAATSSRSFKVLDDNKEIDEMSRFSMRSTSKVATKLVLEEKKENKHENTVQRKLKSTSLGQLRKMVKAKQLNLSDTNDTIVKELLHMAKRPALQQVSNNSLVHEKEN